MADKDAEHAGQPSELHRPRSTPSFRLSRQRSRNERVIEILDNARERADRMGEHDFSSQGPSSRHYQSLSQTSAEEGTPDETTGFRPQSAPRSYQSLQTVDQQAPRRKSSIYSPRSRQRSDACATAGRQDEHDSDRDHDHGHGHEHEHDARGAGDYGESQAAQPWWRTSLEKFRTIELENKGSVARDHLALERTFLAWLRTSLAFASIGIAVTQLFRLNTSLDVNNGNINTDTLRHMGKPLGTAFLGISILILLLGSKRYFEAQQWVMKGKFPASRGTILAVTFVAFGIMVMSLVVIIVIQPEEDGDL